MAGIWLRTNSTEVALDCLYILIYRVTSDEDPLWPIAEALFELESLDALGQVFEMLSGHLKADAGGVDETAYTVLKKLSEVCAATVRHLLTQPRPSWPSEEKYPCSKTYRMPHTAHTSTLS